MRYSIMYAKKGTDSFYAVGSFFRMGLNSGTFTFDQYS